MSWKAKNVLQWFYGLVNQLKFCIIKLFLIKFRIEGIHKYFNHYTSHTNELKEIMFWKVKNVLKRFYGPVNWLKFCMID